VSGVRGIVAMASARGIHLRLEGDQLVIGGAATERFLAWARTHKDEVVAELRKPRDLDALLDEARAGTGFTLKECKSGLLFAPLDLQLIASGEMSVAAAKHFLEYQAGRVCRKCLGGGCRVCNFFGLAPPQIEVPQT